MIIIKQLNPSDHEGAKRWDEFVFACPEATFFHRAAWQGIIRDVFRHPTYFLYAEIAGKIQGVLPLAHVKSMLFGNALVALPFAVYGGVATTNSEAGSALEAEAQKLAQRMGVDHLEFRNLKPRKTSTSLFAKKSCLKLKIICRPFHASNAPWCVKV